jgi:hypothetical protein
MEINDLGMAKATVRGPARKQVFWKPSELEYDGFIVFYRS